MTASELKNSIRFDKVSRTPTTMGGFTEAWTTLCTVWGRYRELGGTGYGVNRELFQQQQLNPLITVEIVIRYRTDITTDVQAFYNTKLHNILNVIDIENRHEWLKLYCEVRHSGQ